MPFVFPVAFGDLFRGAILRFAFQPIGMVAAASCTFISRHFATSCRLSGMFPASGRAHDT
jgi:hypothetical protein